MAESVKVFARRFGWVAPSLPHHHASEATAILARREMPRSALAAIRELNRMDEELYRTAAERFQAALAHTGVVE